MVRIFRCICGGGETECMSVYSNAQDIVLIKYEINIKQVNRVFTGVFG